MTSHIQNLCEFLNYRGYVVKEKRILLIFSPSFIQSKLLHNLHSRRKEILAKIQNMPSSSDEMETNSLLTGCTPSSPSVRDIIKDPYKTASDNFMLSTKSTLNKAVSDTVNANTITSLAEVTHKINSKFSLYLVLQQYIQAC